MRPSSRSTSPPPPPLLDLFALLNPPVVVSAVAECLAGATAASLVPGPKPYVLALASGLLFAAGGLFGSYFDREADAQRAPDRPLPSGRIPAQTAWTLGWALLVAGMLISMVPGLRSGALGMGLAVLVVLYSATAKQIWGLNFLVLGAARLVNLALGFSAGTEMFERLLVVALPFGLYMIGWAVLRGSRQPGAPPSTGFAGLLHVAAALALLVYLSGTHFEYRNDALIFFLLFVPLTLPRFVGAVFEPRRPAVAEAVQYGFLGLTLLEAGLAAGYAGVLGGLIICAFLIPLYLLLRKWPIPLLIEPR
ncbi:MAG: UbiA family prenyltransferase [Armatimonadota bacterium]